VEVVAQQTPRENGQSVLLRNKSNCVNPPLDLLLIVKNELAARSSAIDVIDRAGDE
jgi:hypothetical protein